ncbi:MAG: hypothetical protein AAF826_05340 [Pseudomonadota bacterium]
MEIMSSNADDWTSGSNNWLLDVIAPNAKATASVIANLKQVVNPTLGRSDGMSRSASRQGSTAPDKTGNKTDRPNAGDGDLRIHPIVTRLVEKDVLEKMGAKQTGGDQ